MLLALVASLVVLNGVGWGYGLGPDSSWAEIRSAPGILIQAPMIWFGAHAISVVEVCRSGDTLWSRTSEGMMVKAPLGSTRPSYNIEVDLILSDMRRTREVFLFTKRFEIPTCGKAAE
jgi:hypothetical protein